MNPNLLLPQFGQDYRTPPYVDGPDPRPAMQNPFEAQGLDQSLPTNPTAIATQPRAAQQNAVQEADPIMDLVNKLYSPEHGIADKFEEIWSQMPHREKPGMLRRIMGSLAALSDDPNAKEKVLYAPYNREMADWTDKLKMLQPLLTDERYSNANNRSLATGVATQQTAQNRLAIQQKDVDSKIAQREAATELGQKKLELQQWLANNPGHDLVKDQASGKVYAVDKRDSTKKVDTGLTFDNFSELEKAQYRLREAAVPRTVVTSGTTTSTTTPDTTLAPNQEKVRQYNNAQEAWNTHPEWRKWIKLAEPGTNEFEIAEPGQVRDWWLDKSGPSQEDFDKINQFIKENAAPGTGVPRTTTTSRQSTSTSQKGNAPAPRLPVKRTEAVPDKNVVARAAAIKILQDAKKPVTEANIAYVMKQSGGK